MSAAQASANSAAELRAWLQDAAEREDLGRCAMARVRQLRRTLKRPLRTGDRVEFPWPGDEGLEHNDWQLVAEIRVTHFDVRTADGAPVLRHYW